MQNIRAGRGIWGHLVHPLIYRWGIKLFKVKWKLVAELGLAGISSFHIA